jgi:heterodisulfide reductase subunit A
MARVGVFICHCGANIGGTINIDKVLEAAKKMPMVAFVDANKYTCSEPGQLSVRDAIIKNRLNRVVIGNCSPRMHENTFRKTVAQAGLNPYLLEIANLREHCSWVHGNNKDSATDKAIELVRMAVAKVGRDEALFGKRFGLTKRALVIGGGIAGIQAALDIANAGHEVVLVEREPTVGGRMAQLDKTFPTLDCSACILTPKMVDVAQHPKITLLSYAEVQEVKGFVGNFEVKIKQKARYVDIKKCTACGDCTKGCPVEVLSEFNMGMGKRKAIYIPFPQAVPNKYVIDKRETPPCKSTCPIHMDVQGYLALIANGKFKEAYELIRRTNPLPSVLGRVCYHPCEQACKRGYVDQPLSICSLKRFASDQYDIASLPVPEIAKSGKTVAIIGAGPAGLTAAHDLALAGHQVTIYEALPEPGGMVRVGIPAYRMPRETLKKDIEYIKKLGVAIKCGERVGEKPKLSDLQKLFDAVLMASGAHNSLKLNVPGEESQGVLHGVDFLRAVSLEQKAEIGSRVAVVGGGNTAIDAARTARRLGAKVTIVYRRGRDEMPANEVEILAAEEEGIEIMLLAAPTRVIAEGGKVKAMECVKMKLGAPDASGRPRPEPIAGSEFKLDVDTIIPALGQAPNLGFAKDSNVAVSGRGTVKVDEASLVTSVQGVFACGDAVTGPLMVVDAMASGRKAAAAIDLYLKGQPLPTTAEPKAEAEKPSEEEIEELKEEYPEKARLKMAEMPVDSRIKSFSEVELGFTPEQAMEEAKRCLACGVCSECRECVRLCQAGAINHDMKEEILDYKIGSIVVATGYKTSDPKAYGEFGYGRLPDVITGLQLERLMNASGPTGGEVLRPSDGKHPHTVVFISCVGSRDELKGHSYCSKFCCMYMAKQSIMLKEHDPHVQSYIFYIDIRAGGKDFDEFSRRAQQEYGTLWLRGRVSKLYQDGDKVMVCGEDSLIGRPVEIAADLVVLATAAEPNDGAAELAQTLKVSYDTNHFFIEAHPKLRPVETQTDGIFLAGSCVGPRDIPESVAQGGAAAAKVSALFSQEFLTSDPMVSAIDQAKCSGCLMCQEVCPFSAIESQKLRDGRTVSVTNESLCKGCGLCVAACRFGAANLRGFTQQQLLAEVVSLWQ